MWPVSIKCIHAPGLRDYVIVVDVRMRCREFSDEVLCMSGQLLVPGPPYI